MTKKDDTRPCENASAGCDGEVSKNAESRACTNCRAAVSRWMKRRPAEILERRRKLRMYDHRLAPVIDKKCEGKVHSLRKVAS